jgi:hypothetical protein
MAGGWHTAAMDAYFATHIIYVAVVFLLAGMVKGATGMGLPTVAMGLLGLVMAPMEAAALLVVPSLLTNGWQVLSGRPLYPLWLRLRGMMAGICLGTLVGGALLLQAQGGSAVLGLALVLYGLLGLGNVGWSVPARQEPWLAPLMGAATGVLTALAAAVNMIGNLGAGRLLQRGVRPALLLATGFMRPAERDGLRGLLRR